MGEVDVAHQAEHQREAGRDEEIERAERDAGQDRVEEDPLATHGLLEAGRPRRNDQPCQTDDQDEDDEGPDRMARTEVLQGTHAATSRNNADRRHRSIVRPVGHPSAAKAGQAPEPRTRVSRQPVHAPRGENVSARGASPLIPSAPRNAICLTDRLATSGRIRHIRQSNAFADWRPREPNLWFTTSRRSERCADRRWAGRRHWR